MKPSVCSLWGTAIVMLLVLTLSNCKKDSQIFDPTNPEFEEFFANAVDSVKDHILDSVVNLALAL
ncbi:MAG: hypothetical protein SFV22_20180, partial [Saprospiraceae bacterium]|nr:hypothetical protein [Saprospiraceae bacterium]